jgi:hypothetical protein
MVGKRASSATTSLVPGRGAEARALTKRPKEVAKPKAEPTKKSTKKTSAPKKAAAVKVAAAVKKAKKTKPSSTRAPAKKALEVQARAAASATGIKKEARPRAEGLAKKKGAPAPAAEPVRAAQVETRPEEMKMDSRSNAATPAPRRAVVRIARGERAPQKKGLPVASLQTPDTGRSAEHPSMVRPPPRHPAPKVEINPKYQSSKGIIGRGSAQAPSAPTEPGGKPMSVAAKHRANAEAMFAKFAKPQEAPVPVKEAVPSTPPPPPSPPQYGGGAQSRDQYGAVRINERDTLTTALRLSSSRAETLDAAKQLADRYQLPPDQNLLVKVIELGEARLTKLALEELLELDDRGRVRPNPELRSALTGVRSADPETEELKQLFLQKIGAGA